MTEPATMLHDVVLPRRTVLDTTMAYREAGLVGGPVALFLSTTIKLA